MTKGYHPTVRKIKQLLDSNNCKYRCFEHEAVRTSEEASALRPEFTLAQGAKALIVRIKKKKVRKFGELSQEVTSNSDIRKNVDNMNNSCKEDKEEEKQFAQIVVPGDCKFNPRKARAALGAKDIRFAHEEEVLEITNGIQPGGVPPFGVLWNVPVYVDETLLENEEIIFNAGDRKFSIAMKSEDYIDIVKPTVVSIV